MSYHQLLPIFSRSIFTNVPFNFYKGSFPYLNKSGRKACTTANQIPKAAQIFDFFDKSLLSVLFRLLWKELFPYLVDCFRKMLEIWNDRNCEVNKVKENVGWRC